MDPLTVLFDRFNFLETHAGKVALEEEEEISTKPKLRHQTQARSLLGLAKRKDGTEGVVAPKEH
jgi:hypothetical protein